MTDLLSYLKILGFSPKDGVNNVYSKKYKTNILEIKALKKEDADGIYHQFAEILRHNVVSDKPNAFNKIINMFLCKIRKTTI